jgi:serine/threonine protein kinase
MHSHSLVHRDIKPDNILFYPQDNRQIRLIDFGLACPYDREPMSTTTDIIEPEFVLGTLDFASLNAHNGLRECSHLCLSSLIIDLENSAALSRRDDLESLAYTLFSTLRGCLPWDKPYVHSSTRRNVRRRVHAKKRAWSGKRLAEGYDAVALGRFLDEMRGLEYNEAPSYHLWRKVFSDIAEQQRSSLPFNFAAGCSTGQFSGQIFYLEIYLYGSAAGTPPVLSKPKQHPCIVELGQLIYAQVLPRMTIEGYTISQQDSSNWLDPSLCDEEWPAMPRPAVVLKVWNDWRGKSLIKVAPITCRKLYHCTNKALLTADENSNGPVDREGQPTQ